MADDAVSAHLHIGAADWHPTGEMSFTLSDVARATGGRLVAPAAGEVLLDRLVTDSRQAGTGALFVALAGEAMDGHEFLTAAARAGASALLCRKAPAGVDTPMVIVPDTREALVTFSRDRLARNGVKVVAVTGSAGKTTTKEMMAGVLARGLAVLKTEGNLNTYTGLPMALARLEPSHDVFVAEYGMSALGEIAFLARMAPPDIAVVLNVGLAHVGMLGGIDAVARAKRELVEGVNPGGTAVLNADDHRVAAMATAALGTVHYFSTGEVVAEGVAPEYRASGIRVNGLRGSSFTLHVPGDAVEVTLAVPGAHTVSNAVAAAAVGHLMGIPLPDIAAALAAFRPVGGRMNLKPGREGSMVIDDAYNASPGSMEASLLVLGAEPERYRIAVLGDMLELGDEAVAAHRRMGAAAAGAANLLVALGDYAEDVVEAAREAGLDPQQALVVDDVDAALRAIEDRLRGALVLVKASRGMALDRVVDRLVQE
ncbi:MAG: UDP-N-acetylmuramoyl-tripeptide--D-alanyl-D-alanine ligase [Candidatus Dormibacteria bacterium]